MTKKTITTRTEEALSLLHRGWAIIPVHVPVDEDCSCGRDCNWPGKHPRVSWREYTERLPTEDEVRQWFEDEFYGSNLGVVTGSVSDLVVVDVDGTLDQYQALDLPETLVSRTGGGGYHFFFRLGGRNCSSGISVVSGIDIKGNGGFVVLPPSRHVSGFKYEWLNWRKPTLIRTSRLPKRVRPEESNGEWVGSLLSGVAEGERSITAARLAGRYAQIGLTMDETVLLLSSWNMFNSPPLTVQELSATIRSVYTKHRDKYETQLSTVEDLYQTFLDITGRSLT